MSLKIIYLGTHSPLIEYLQQWGEVKVTQDKIDPEDLKKYDWAISYGYRHILNRERIEAVRNPIINLHTSYLPWNRGAHPNYWSWKNQTPKGVTIHAIDQGIDTGDIYVQKEVVFEKEETLSSTYRKLKEEIESLFREFFPLIISGKIKPKPQTGKGSIHYKKELPKDIDWNIKVNDL